MAGNGAVWIVTFTFGSDFHPRNIRFFQICDGLLLQVIGHLNRQITGKSVGRNLITNHKDFTCILVRKFLVNQEVFTQFFPALLCRNTFVDGLLWITELAPELFQLLMVCIYHLLYGNRRVQVVLFLQDFHRLISVQAVVDIIFDAESCKGLCRRQIGGKALSLQPLLDFLIVGIVEVTVFVLFNWEVVGILLIIFNQYVDQLQCGVVDFFRGHGADIEGNGKDLLVFGQHIAVSVINITSRCRGKYGLRILVYCFHTPTVMLQDGNHKQAYSKYGHQNNDDQNYFFVSVMKKPYISIHR